MRPATTTAARGSVEWLRAELGLALPQFDPIIVDSLVDNLASGTSSKDEIEDLLQNFVADEPQALRIIRTFLDGQQSGRKQAAADIASLHEPGMRLLARDDESLARQYQVGPAGSSADTSGRGAGSASSPARSGAAAGGKTWRGAVGAGSDSEPQGGKQQQQQQQQQGFSSPAARDGRQVQDQLHGAGGSSSGPAQGGGKVLGMFKQGGRLKPSVGKPRRDDQGLATAAALERKVVNCLGCGKIYDCRNTTNDVIKFLDLGGTCTFCGRKVPLTYRGRAEQEEEEQAAAAAHDSQAGAERSQERPASNGMLLSNQTSAAAGSQQHPQQAGVAMSPGYGADGPDGGSSSSSSSAPAARPGMDAATAAAVAFKDRLVGYDRESARRTAVIDDQSDFFDVDANAWLTDEERAQAKERRRLEAEAEAARRRRVAVTLDLVGRRVLLADPGADSAQGDSSQGASFRTGSDALVAAYDPRSTLANSKMWDKQASSRGAAAGGTGSGGRTQSELVLKAAEGLHSLRVTSNPSITTAAPRFVSKAGDQGQGAEHGKQQQQQQQHGPGGRGQGSNKPGSRSGRGGAASAAAAAGGSGLSSRLQYDFMQEFDDFGQQVLFESDEEAELAAEASRPFDLCPPEYQGLPPPKPLGPVERQPNEVTDLSQLPPGVVLLKGWLTLEQQVAVIQECRQLGMGHGGFYTPSYGTGQQMHLRMMGLGKHWEPRSHSYEDIRSAYDGATPPPIPTLLHSLCSESLAAATEYAKAHQKTQLPPLKPDICLVNFYEKTGRLGMHQDKDETSDSLRKGLPVVSFSLGDTADFVFGKTVDEKLASCVKLESGDVLVFGGPSRMVFHAVPKIYPGTAPPQLVQASGLRPGRLNLTFRQL